MTPSWMSALPHADSSACCVCQSLPGYLLASGRHDVARDILVHLAKKSENGLIRSKVGSGHGDVEATLWFARAAYMYHQAARDAATWGEVLLPTLKKGAQGLIAGPSGSTRMDDGGMLSPADSNGSTPCPVGMNALWYNLMSLLAEELHAVKDHAGDHFERLAGRFRRSFAKAFWCSAHGFLCDPELQKMPDHATVHAVPDPEQLLIATLPFSPLPKTKQRQIVMAVREKGRGPTGGVLVPATSRESGVHGKSVPADLTAPLYLAWLIEGNVRTADVPEKVVGEAASWCGEFPGEPMARFYVNGSPAALPHNDHPHAPTCAEARRARQMAKVG